MIREYIVKISDEVMENDAELFKNPPMLVRCKDCRFRYTECCITKHLLPDDFYCGQGTRKDGEQDV